MDPDPGIDDQKTWKNLQWEIFLNTMSFWSKIAIYLYLGLHKGRPTTGEAFSPQKRTSST